jgi:hypothetical protein
MRAFLKKGVEYLKRYGARGTLSRYLFYQNELNLFLKALQTAEEKNKIKKLIHNFSRIDRKLPCWHSPFQFFEIARYLLDLEIDGPMVECGCALGGSTAKLSLLAKETERKLYVCDSFEGMPPLPDGKQEIIYKGKYHQPSSVTYQGKFRTTLKEVKANIRKFGCIEVCEFIPGYFGSTLPKLEINPAFVYNDVAIVSSARDCIKFLWPRLKPGGYWFTHEAGYLEYVYGLFDRQWWLENLGEPPPLVIGAGSGLSLLSPSLAYFQKDGSKYYQVGGVKSDDE